MLLLIHGIIAGVLILLGVLFLNGKGSFLIAGYNTASKAEKEKMDEKKLCKYNLPEYRKPIGKVTSDRQALLFCEKALL